MKPTAMDLARAAWPAPMPDWIEALAIACTVTSQAKVATRLGRTGGMISQLINNKYPASTDPIEERVRGVLLNGKVQCPSLGALPVNQCQDWRLMAKDFQVGNPTRTRMFRACRRCPRFTEVSE
ncbi:hypothetical protein [Cypionkella psychrotolerans]|uniref:hypothetical protein n=1 Tax=Cypionkella psychrotolerans TaxID=1678131 RepID=UPI000B192F8F|nr:hypothetical protein [Cypionkella psychrotolerans]